MQALKLGIPSQDTLERTHSVYNRKNGRPDSKDSTEEKRKVEIKLEHETFRKKIQKIPYPENMDRRTIWSEAEIFEL